MASVNNCTAVLGKWGKASYKPMPAMLGTPKAPETKKKFFTTKNDDGSAEASIKVAVRIKPDDDAHDGSPPTLDFDEVNGEMFLNYKRSFKFDHVFGPNSTQFSVFETLVKPSLEVLLRRSATDSGSKAAAIVTYGQTGSGKTYTLGTDFSFEKMAMPSNFGIIPRVIQYVFEHVPSSSTLKASFFEIHNEKLYDLLKGGNIRVPLRIKEDVSGFTVAELSHNVVSCGRESLDLLEKGSKVRSTAQTDQNLHSSRSHAIFRLTISDGDFQRRIDLIDLAGSEPIDSDLTRREEGKHINLGLSALNRCITATCHRERHVPYRDSTLTKVLRDCLTSGGMTTLICCISSSEASLRETTNTLRYAYDVKKLKKPPLPSMMEHVPLSVIKKREAKIPKTPGPKKRGLVQPSTPKPLKTQDSFCCPTKISRVRFETDDNYSFDLDNEAETSAASSTSSSNTTNRSLIDVVDARAFLSPVMRQMRAEIKQQIEESVKNQFEASMQMSWREPQDTRSRNVRRSVRLQEKVDNAHDETLISGPLFSESRNKMRNADAKGTPTAQNPKILCDITNKRKQHHLRQVEATASPDFKRSEAKKRLSSLEVNEMAESLGIDPDSPTLSFTTVSDPASARRVSKRSVRRTTMLQTELEKSLSSFAEGSRRRSVRIAQNQQENLVHALDNASAWKVNNQEKHNKTVLDILNTGNFKTLQVLPGIGPKTAIVLHSFRELHQGFASLEDVKKVPGLPKTFFPKFCEKNCISLS